MILMKFNSGVNTNTLEDLSELGIPQQELKRHLVSMCTPRHRIFTKSPKGKEIKEGDIFTVNESYTSKLKRVKVPLVSAKETSTSSTFFVYAMRCFSQYTKKFSLAQLSFTFMNE